MCARALIGQDDVQQSVLFNLTKKMMFVSSLLCVLIFIQDVDSPFCLRFLCVPVWSFDGWCFTLMM